MLRRRRAIALAACGVISLAVGTAHATLLYYEGFDYAPGPTTEPPTPWNNNQAGYGLSPYSTFEAGSVAYPSLQTTGNHLAMNDPDGPEGADYVVNDSASGPNTMFSVAGTYYYTFAGQIQTDNSTLDGLGALVLHSRPGSNGYGAGGYLQIAAQANGGGEISVSLEAGQNGGGSNLIAPAVVHPNPFFVAVRVINDGTSEPDDIRLMFNPDLSLGEPDWNAATLVKAADITSSADPNALFYFTRNHLWDEIRIASSWAEAAPVVPEPLSTVTCALVAGTLAMMRKRR
jgi:hypothetical protein